MKIRLLQRIGQVSFIWIAEASALALLVEIIPGLAFGTHYGGFRDLLIPAMALGLANAALRPLMLAVTVPRGALIFGVIAAALNGLLLYTFPSLNLLELHGTLTMAVSAIALAVINTVLTTIVSIDDEDRFYRRVIRNFAKNQEKTPNQKPGLLVVEIDGLAYKHMQVARARGRLPYIDRLIRERGHAAAEWDCGVPSQTSSSQAGIMFGSSHNIPAFRWFDRLSDRVIVSGNPKDARTIEEALNGLPGLLRGGSSVNNLLSGGAARVAITLSSMGSSGNGSTGRERDILNFFLNPYCLSRALILVVWQMFIQGIQELWAFIRRKRVHGPLYPLNRALSTVLLRDLGTYLVVQDLMQGSPAIYVSFIGYDVVSHGSGPIGGAVFGVLSAIDRQIGRLLDVASSHAPRPYRCVILSDHGQSPGISFKERYGEGFTSCVQRLVSGTDVGELSAAYPGYLQALLMELKDSEEVPTLGRRRKQALRQSRLYLERRLSKEDSRSGQTQVADRVVVCCSGNLAHIYFRGTQEPVYFEQIDEMHPELIAGLLAHPGIGFLLVRSLNRGLLLLGPRGLRVLQDNVVEGIDPLGELRRPEVAVRQISHFGRFPHMGDIVANSIIEGDHVASFENQTGSHGGIGGPQNYPFVIVPAPDAAIFSGITSPEQLYPVLSMLRGSEANSLRAV